jgi:mono/diheme cytochrome c family protein
MAQQKTESQLTRGGRRQASARRLLNQRNVIVAFVVLCSIGLMVFAVRTASRPAQARVDRSDATNRALVAQGKQLYATRCAPCHGADLQGEQDWPQRRPNGVMPAAPLDAHGTAWQRDDQWLFTTIKQGGQATALPGYTSFMPASGGLTDTEIWAVISYVKSTWPKQLQDAQPQSQ